MAVARSLDPLRYGIRALDEMAREQASVAPPPRVVGDVFAPHLVLRSSSPDGAALTLRLFSDAPDDATSLVVGEASSQRFDPVPARAGALFEAHATFLATGTDDTLTLGFPLVTFLHQGSLRAAPLFSLGGARARWSVGKSTWGVPSGARSGAALTLPTALDLAIDDDAAYALHGGVWHTLFGLDGASLAAIAKASRGGLGALVRAATLALDAGEADTEEPVAGEALAEADLVALCEAASRRASKSRGVRCYPHGLAMLPPRGDPTSNLRTELRSLVGEAAPKQGPLAVYLGAKPSAPRVEPVWSSGAIAPTSSQLAAAQALEGSRDIVAVCGPPGCGKTALLHLVTAQTVVACALAGHFGKAPPRSASWPLVVTSTNNAAVDQALAPFVASPDLPIALRLGNRRTLEETTVPSLAAALAALGRRGSTSLADARAAFDARAQPAREAERAIVAAKKANDERAAKRKESAERAKVLRALVASVAGRTVPNVDPAVLEEARVALEEHTKAASKLVSLHLEGKNASIPRACEKWARANELRAPRIVPALAALALASPLRPLDPEDPHEDAARQRMALEAALAKVKEAHEVLAALAAEGELATLASELAIAPTDTALVVPDPALYEAALVLRDAWAREHREDLGRRMSAALAAMGEGRVPGRSKPLSQVLMELSPLFPVAGCTLLSMRTGFPLEADVIDRLVVDEAGQCAPVYAIPALARARRAMLTGDTAQLPPVYTLDPRVDERLAKGLDPKRIEPFRMGAEAIGSAQAVAEAHATARVPLVEHFRSQPAIVAIASRWSGYRLDVRTEPRSLAHLSPRLRSAVEVVAVPGHGERAAAGVVNEAEAMHAVELVSALLADGVAASDIAVLTPFVGQYVHIERALHARGHVHRGGVLVSTVHRLQGGERRVVVFSVTATRGRHLRFIAERPHLLHVATSRARDHLVVLVDPAAVTKEAALTPIRELLRC